MSSLNNGAYIYDSAGYNFASRKTELLGSAHAQFGVQFGYTDLGTYENDVSYGSAPNNTYGYRKAQENAADMLLASTLYWEKGFNLFFKAPPACTPSTRRPACSTGGIPPTSPPRRLSNTTSFVPS
jgi:hypothetical protein